MTVWELLRALLGYAIRGRGRHRVYIVLGQRAPEKILAEFDARVWTLTETYTPYTPQDRFVLATAQPGPVGIPDGSRTER
jgi:hypothetical protein